MERLKKEFKATSDYRRRLQILPLSPFGIDRTADFFETSKYMVKKSRKLKDERGIFPETPKLSKGKRVTPEDRRSIIEFYESDEVSRLCAGSKDFVMVRNEDGEKVKKQKRLILGNLREIYVSYKSLVGDKALGFSTFAALRPRHCVLPGPSGTHTVCVCVQHQNAKLMVESLGVTGLSYHDLIEFAVCDAENQDCMLGKCSKCPGEGGVLSFLEAIEDEFHTEMNMGDVISYKQWVSTDRCSLADQIDQREVFMTKLSQCIVKLTRHHIVSKSQSRSFSDMKKNVREREAVVVGDFSENYSFVIQDAIQGWHWDASQATVHPFVAYFREGGEVVHQSFCYISDGLKHNAAMVHCFLQDLVPALKVRIPNLEKIHYFSDGCAAQYKNRFNFINICHHRKDFDVQCDWNFFGTSHGKTSCDGIGGTVKRATARASLTRTRQHHIVTAQGMYEFLSQEFVSDIHFVFVSNEKVLGMSDSLKERFSKALAVRGTKNFHKFSPVDENSLLVFEMSSMAEGRHARVTK